MKSKTFDCGCTFNVDDHDGIIYMAKLDGVPGQNFSFDCPLVWDLFADGNTKGVFQLESQLGRGKSKEVQPRSIQELSDLIAIIRPGSSQALLEDGKSATWHYIQRKHGREEATYIHPALEPILNTTYGVLCYQEQALRIVKEIAGFSMEEAEVLRKAIGKKKADLMADMKKLFIEKANSYGIVNEHDAAEIFNWIEASQRYSFNLSHSVSYAYNSFMSAHAKAHMPFEFFASYLRHADGKQDKFEEIRQLINNAKTMNIDVYGPDIRHMNSKFDIIDQKIYYGLTDIKSFGNSDFEALKTRYSNSIKTFDHFLFAVGMHLSKDAMIALICSGALDYFNVPRQQMQYIFTMLLEIGKREWLWLQNNFLEKDTIPRALERMINFSKACTVAKDRAIYKTSKYPIIQSIIDSIQNPPYNTNDDVCWLSEQELKYLGYEITCSRVDVYDASNASCTCKDFLAGYGSPDKLISILVKIKAAREYTIKSGKNKGRSMLFMTVYDSSCELDNVTVFSDKYEELKDYLYVGNILLLVGKRDKNKNGFNVESIREAIK